MEGKGWHVHQSEERIIYIIPGKFEMYFNGVLEELKLGFCVYIPRGVEPALIIYWIQYSK